MKSLFTTMLILLLSACVLFDKDKQVIEDKFEKDKNSVLQSNYKLHDNPHIVEIAPAETKDMYQIHTFIQAIKREKVKEFLLTISSWLSSEEKKILLAKKNKELVGLIAIKKVAKDKK